MSRIVDLVESVHQLPYVRPSDRSVEGMLRERRGTCSTKHRFLYDELAREFPELYPRLVHRVYRIMPDEAENLFDPSVRKFVPENGLTDVHRYLLIIMNGYDVTIDARFPGHKWDGQFSMLLACGPGEDYQCA